jgi:hypothetical protein
MLKRIWQQFHQCEVTGGPVDPGPAPRFLLASVKAHWGRLPFGDASGVLFVLVSLSTKLHCDPDRALADNRFRAAVARLPGSWTLDDFALPGTYAHLVRCESKQVAIRAAIAAADAVAVALVEAANFDAPTSDVPAAVEGEGTP